MLQHVGHDIDHCVSMLSRRHCEESSNCGHVSNVNVPYVYGMSHVQLLLPITEEDVQPIHLLPSPG
jgi:hypothetical protein